MLNNSAWLAAGAALSLALTTASATRAQTVPPAVQNLQSPPPAAPAARTRMADGVLAGLDGRGDPAGTLVKSVTDQDLTAVNSGNSIVADSVGSGAISLQGNAFSSFNGVGNIMMNTGHNNNLQSTVSVTVIIGP